MASRPIGDSPRERWCFTPVLRWADSVCAGAGSPVVKSRFHILSVMDAHLDGFGDFPAFRAAYKAEIRPDGTLERMRRAFGVDVSFLETYRLLRPYLRRFDDMWSDLIVSHVTQSASGAGAFDAKHAGDFSYIYKLHMRSIREGRFDEYYLSTLEDVALYMAYRDIKSVWLAGAYQDILSRMIRFVFERTEEHRLVKIERLIQVLSKTVAIEMNQVQRVFTVLETQRLHAFIDDLQHGADLRTRAASAQSALAAVTPAQAAIVQETFRSIAPQADLAAKKFYNRLFDLDESLRPLFPDDLTPQRAKLTNTLAAAIDRLDRIDLLAPELEALGRRHASYKVKPEHYDTVGDALLWTLERGLGPQWTPDAAAAWTAVYTALATTMIAATADDAAAARHAAE